MDWNKDISKIVYPIFGLFIGCYYLFSFYSSYQIDKFVDIYNEQNQYIGKVFQSFGDKTLSSLFGAGDISDIKISDDEYNKATNLTNNMILNGCPLLKYNTKRCEKINSDLLMLIKSLHNEGKEGVEDKINSFNYDFDTYKIFLKNEGIDF